MLVWNPCNGACDSNPVALASCTTQCRSVGQGYEIRWRVERLDTTYSGTCDCASAPLAMCNINVGDGARPGAYRATATLRDNNTNTDIETHTVITVYDPNAVKVKVNGPGALHVLDPALGAPATIMTISGDVYLPRSVPAVFSALGPKIRLMAASGDKVIDTGYVDYAVLDYSIKFSDEKTMFSWLATMAGTPAVAALGFDAVDCPDVVGEDVAWSIMEMYAMAALLQSGLNVAGIKLDRDNYAVTLRVVARSGSFLGLDLKRLLGFAAGGCLIGAAVAVIGGPITVGAVLTGCFVGGVVGASVDVVAQGLEKFAAGLADFVDILRGRPPAEIRVKLENSIRETDTAISKIESDINNACNAGKIQSDVCDTLRNDINVLKSAWAQHKKVVGQVVKLPQTAALMGLVVGLGGGAALGYVAASRATG